MRRLACLLMAVGCVLLALTVVGASRPEPAPARVVPTVGTAHVPAGLRRALDRLVHGLGGAPVTTGRRVVNAGHRPRARSITPVAPLGQTCAIGGQGCSLHPCRLYADQTSPAVLPLMSVVPARARRGGRAPSASAVAPARRQCRAARPEFASARVSG